MTVTVFDDRRCALGEGALWHPLRKQLFWFDILGKKLLTKTQSSAREWRFDETVTAAGWVDHDTLLVASETGLWQMNLVDGHRQIIYPLEQENKITRSNDGRADPWGGFWIGTMGNNAEKTAGAIYRYHQGTLRKLVSDVTIPNAICFAPNRTHAYFTDTPTGKIMKLPLDQDGWPDGPSAILVDLKPQGLNPDGAVVDAKGTIWVALWGASLVAAYQSDGRLAKKVSLPAEQPTCPAFGGEHLGTFFATSAAHGLGRDETSAASDQQGMTFAFEGLAQGLAEPRVSL